MRSRELEGCLSRVLVVLSCFFGGRSGVRSQQSAVAWPLCLCTRRAWMSKECVSVVDLHIYGLAFGECHIVRCCVIAGRRRQRQSRKGCMMGELGVLCAGNLKVCVGESVFIRVLLLSRKAIQVKLSQQDDGAQLH